MGLSQNHAGTAQYRDQYTTLPFHLDKPTNHRVASGLFHHTSQHAKLKSQSRIMLLAAKHQIAHRALSTMWATGTRCCFWPCGPAGCVRAMLPRDSGEDAMFGCCFGPDLYQTIHLFHAPCHTVSCHQCHFFLSLFYLFAALLSFFLRKRLPLHSRLYRAFILLLSFTCSASFIEGLPIVLVALQLYPVNQETSL